MKLIKNKTYTFCLLAIILIGIVVVLVKGFNVDIDLQEHNTLKFKFDQKFEMDDVQRVCEEILEDKEYEIKTVEIFSDAVYIMSPNITDKEKTRLIESLGNLYERKSDDTTEIPTENNPEGTTNVDEATAPSETQAPAEDANTQNGENTIAGFTQKDDYDFYTDGKVRLRELVSPYIIPTIISSVIILIYIGIKYRKLNGGKIYITLFEIIIESIIFALVLVSAVAIIRVPVGRMLLPILMFIMICWLILKCRDFEKELKEAE